jgi:hypothetical protein
MSLLTPPQTLSHGTSSPPTSGAITYQLASWIEGGVPFPQAGGNVLRKLLRIERSRSCSWMG